MSSAITSTDSFTRTRTCLCGTGATRAGRCALQYAQNKMYLVSYLVKAIFIKYPREAKAL